MKAPEFDFVVCYTTGLPSAPGVHDVLAEHQKCHTFATQQFFNNSLYNETFNYKILDLLTKNNHETKNFSISVLVIELRWVVRRKSLMFG